MIIALIVSLLVSSSMASTPTTWLVKAPQANPHEFFVFAQNSADGKISQALTYCDKTSMVNQLLKEAQFNFLNGSLDAAKKKFTEISENKWSCDWKTDERKIITFSFFRMAQLSNSPSEQMGFLTEAISFDDEVTPDVSVFPPPIIEMYRKTKAQMARKQMMLPDTSKKFSGLFRNGKFISLNALAINTYPMRARLTLVSDTYRPETRVITPDEFQNSQLDPRPLVDGTCENFSVSEDLQVISSYKVFFGPDCIKANKDSSTLNTSAVAHNAAASGFSPDLSNSTPASTRKKSWVERNLLWVGITVVSGIAIAHMVKQNQQSETVVRPTNTLSEGN